MSESLSKCERDLHDWFLQTWAEASPFGTVERVRDHGFRPAPCECGEPDCIGWRMDGDLRVMQRRMIEETAASFGVPADLLEDAALAAMAEIHEGTP